MGFQLTGFAKANHPSLLGSLRQKDMPKGVHYVDAQCSHFVFSFPAESSAELDARREAIHYWMSQGATIEEIHVTEV